MLPMKELFSRNSRVRTDDLCFPKAALYQTEPYPDTKSSMFYHLYLVRIITDFFELLRLLSYEFPWHY